MRPGVGGERGGRDNGALSVARVGGSGEGEEGDVKTFPCYGDGAKHNPVPLSTCIGEARARECDLAMEALNEVLQTGTLAGVGCCLSTATLAACEKATVDDAQAVLLLVQADMSAGGEARDA
jgi:hypothetical protein